MIEALKALYDGLPESGQADALNKELAARRAIYDFLSKSHELVQKQIQDSAAADDTSGLRSRIADRRRVVGNANKNSAQRFREAFVPVGLHGAIGTEASIVVDGADQERESYFDDAGRLMPEKVMELAASSDEWAGKLKGVLGVLATIHSEEAAIQTLESQADHRAEMLKSCGDFAIFLSVICSASQCRPPQDSFLA